MKKILILLAAAFAFSCSDKQAQQQQKPIDEMQALELQEPSRSATAASSAVESSAESVAASSSSAIEISSSTTESSSSISNTLDAKVIEKIQTFYRKYIFGNEFANDSVIAQYCTKSLAKKLRNDYDNEYSDGGGYAVWKFRSNAQDGEDIQEIENIEPLGERKYLIHYNDMGNKGSHTITVVIQGDAIFFDKLD